MPTTTPSSSARVSILKISDEEAELLVDGYDERALGRLGVPEVVVTLGSRGCIVFADGVAELVRAHAVESADPTGAGDAFCDRVPRGAERRRLADLCRPPGRRARQRPPCGPRCVIAHVLTTDGLALVDLDEETVLGLEDGTPFEPAVPPPVSLPLLVAAARRARPSSPSSRRSRRSWSRTTRADLARVGPRAPAGQRSQSPTTTPT